MFKTLRIIFTVISALFAAAVFPIGFFGGLTWALASAVIAFLFFGLMLLCKQSQEAQEARETKKNTSSPSPDEPTSNANTKTKE